MDTKCIHFLMTLEVLIIAKIDSNELPINENIRAEELMVIGPNGEQMGMKNIKDALTLANYAGLDLVLMNASNDHAVGKIMDYNKYKYIRLEAIKSIYITENLSTICQYADPRLTPFDVSDLYSCAVLIETYPEGKIPTEAGKGVRKTWLDGYSQVKEFYHPNYSVLPPVPDYRRTLYWNPSVTPDKEGKAHIRFYNNSRCRKLKISAETITTNGLIGTYGN